MTHISIERNGKTYHVPEASVSDLMSLLDARFEDDRLALLKDLEDIGATIEEKMEQLTEFRATKGLTSVLMRSAFNLRGATQIIKHVADPDDLDQILDAAPDELVWLALKVLGYEAVDPTENDDKEEEDESAEGKANSPETST